MAFSFWADLSWLRCEADFHFLGPLLGLRCEVGFRGSGVHGRRHRQKTGSAGFRRLSAYAGVSGRERPVRTKAPARVAPAPRTHCAPPPLGLWPRDLGATAEVRAARRVGWRGGLAEKAAATTYPVQGRRVVSDCKLRLRLVPVCLGEPGV